MHIFGVVEKQFPSEQQHHINAFAGSGANTPKAAAATPAKIPRRLMFASDLNKDESFLKSFYKHQPHHNESDAKYQMFYKY